MCWNSQRCWCGWSGQRGWCGLVMLRKMAAIGEALRLRGVARGDCGGVVAAVAMACDDNAAVAVAVTKCVLREAL